MNSNPSQLVDPTLHGPIPVRSDWLALREEPVIDPELPIIDAHHHLWTRSYAPYMFDDLLADVQSGHKVAATIFVQCSTMYRSDGPENMKPLGEVEFANGVAAMSASGAYGQARLCAGIVGFADLLQGRSVRPLLEAQMKAAGERFKGIRTLAAWSPVQVKAVPDTDSRQQLLSDKTYREGLAELVDLGLSLDVLIFHTQIDEIDDLARAFPSARIVVNHMASPVISGPYRERADEMRQLWREGIKRLSDRPNVYLKLGGIASRLSGSMMHTLPEPPSSERLAAHFQPFVTHCVDYFGAERCMFESNFPVDKGQTSYRLLWNAFKLASARYNRHQREALFWRTANDFYRLDIKPGT